MKRILLTIIACIALPVLQACGGGGGGGSSSSVASYSGLTSEARVEEANAESLSTAVASGASQSVVADAAGGAFAPRATADVEAKLVEVSPRIAQWIASTHHYSGKTLDVTADFCDVGGTAIADTNDAETVGTITFTNCGIRVDATDVIYLTGTLDYTITLVSGSPDTLSMTFHVNVTYDGETVGINLTLNCVNLSGSASCTIRSDFVGVDGRVYRIMDINVTPWGSGYDISATVYDPDHGRVDMITTAPLAFDCPNGVPSTGTVQISGSDSTSGTISFDSCTDYNVTIDGVSTPYNWP